MLDDLDDDQLNSGESFENDKHVEDGHYDRIGNEGKHVIEQMMEMDNIIKNSGWMQESVDGIPNTELNIIQPEIIQSASKWDAAVQAKQQQFLEEKNCHMPTHPNSKQLKKDETFGNDVLYPGNS